MVLRDGVLRKNATAVLSSTTLNQRRQQLLTHLATTPRQYCSSCGPPCRWRAKATVQTLCPSEFPAALVEGLAAVEGRLRGGLPLLVLGIVRQRWLL